MMPSIAQNEQMCPALPPHVVARENKSGRLRILHVIPQLMPGGTEYTLLRLIRGLGEEEFLGRPVQGAPLLDVPLQGVQLPLGKATGLLALKPVKHGPGLQARVKGQLLLDARPDLGERVDSRPPGMLHAHLAGQPAEPAVLARGLVVEAGPGAGLALGESLVVQAAETADRQRPQS